MQAVRNRLGRLNRKRKREEMGEEEWQERARAKEIWQRAKEDEEDPSRAGREL